jgi:hypothetical protein
LSGAGLRGGSTWALSRRFTHNSGRVRQRSTILFDRSLSLNPDALAADGVVSLPALCLPAGLLGGARVPYPESDDCFVAATSVDGAPKDGQGISVAATARTIDQTQAAARRIFMMLTLRG